MFDKLIRELKKLEKFGVSIPIQVDEDGYLDRECPDEECHFAFKVNAEDWTNIFKDEAIFCPMCGGQSPASAFFTTEQVEDARSQGIAYLQGRIGKSMHAGARDFNRKQPKSGFISMSIKVTGTKPEKVMMPIPARDTFERKFTCDKCKSRYAVIGSAFFCPCCGYNSVEQTFDNSIEYIETSVKSIEMVRTALSTSSKDTAEITCRSLVEKGLIDCVVSFQRFCDVLYKSQPGAKAKIQFNAFQNIDAGSELWRELLNESYSDWITNPQLSRLRILFQRRHLLQHTEGIVDQMYLEKTNDRKYRLGQRVIVTENHVLELAGYVRVITATLKQKVKF